MYIDFHKYNYDLVSAADKQAFIDRDKNSYKQILKKWLDDNLNDIVDRKWEIEEIYFLKDISDFIKLLREGETIYELGFYTSCIALIGISAEDFSKFLSIKLGQPTYVDLKQWKRLKELLDNGYITQDVYDLLDNIRDVRNNCLHYDQNFKQKTPAELKHDSLTVLNDLKNVLKLTLGLTGSFDKEGIIEIIEEISTTTTDTRNFDEVQIKLKNAMSHLLKFPMAFNPKEKFQIRFKYFEVLDIDDDEITLKELPSQNIVYVELPTEAKEIVNAKNISQGDIVFASIYSVIDINGMTAEWNLLDIQKQTT